MWGSDHSSRNSNIFIDWLTDSNSILLNTTVPTYRNSTGKTSLIDLTICSSSLYGHTNCYVSNCFFDSDHSPVITEFSLIRPSKRYITQPQIQGNIFADFASKNAYHEPILLDFFHKEDNNLNKPFHIFETHRAIKLSKNSTPGADHITASFLKNLDRSGCEIKLRYFQDLFDNAIVPNSWKHAVILPIPKQCKDKTRISSYRPIALTSIFSKTFERVLTNRLSYFLTTERKLHPQHYGFVPFKDSRSATYLIHKAIMNAKLKKKYFVGDKSLPVQIIRGLFDETVNRNFQDFYIIATDASKNEQITSIAEYEENGKIRIHELELARIKATLAFSGESQNTVISGAKKKFNLPKLEFRQFSGDIKDWLQFWSQFQYIHDDDEIAPENKFQYLVQATVNGSRAREVVESFPATAANYAKAVDSLKARFGRDDLLVEVYVREL
ncbi:putative RNA-directed DNA polymerase from transposon BS [Trichonephila clavipes]|nr:putative RNA-directed DNA polymerase from transposon BS [Trichonephila clavipes]